jgi:hypothetical protein
MRSIFDFLMEVCGGDGKDVTDAWAILSTHKSTSFLNQIRSKQLRCSHTTFERK